MILNQNSTEPLQWFWKLLFFQQPSIQLIATQKVNYSILLNVTSILQYLILNHERVFISLKNTWNFIKVVAIYVIFWIFLDPLDSFGFVDFTDFSFSVIISLARRVIFHLYAKSMQAHFLAVALHFMHCRLFVAKGFRVHKEENTWIQIVNFTSISGFSISKHF